MFRKNIGLPLAFIERTCVDWCGQHPGGRHYFRIQSFRKAILLICPDNRRVDETTRVDTRMVLREVWHHVVASLRANGWGHIGDKKRGKWGRRKAVN